MMTRLKDAFFHHRNLALLGLLLVTLCASHFSHLEQLESARPTVTIPVISTVNADQSAVDRYKQEREDGYRADLAALQALCDQEKLDAQSREDAAARLTELVTLHQAQEALEKALSGSALSPCAAVVTRGAVTLVTEKSELSSGDMALALTLCKAHANVDPAGVRILTAE